MLLDWGVLGREMGDMWYGVCVSNRRSGERELGFSFERQIPARNENDLSEDDIQARLAVDM
jgi:hypothetical protein